MATGPLWLAHQKWNLGNLVNAVGAVGQEGEWPAGRVSSAGYPVPWWIDREVNPLSFRLQSKAGLTPRISQGRTRMSHLTRAWGSQQHEAGGSAGGLGDKTRGSGDKNKLLDLLAEQCSTQHMGLLALWDREYEPASD